uniref:Endoplasmic reticulum protein 27 n=1 Tax=Pavo cristatus TaxID=9049 RepID=A0A8C9FRB4_PAVCR
MAHDLKKRRQRWCPGGWVSLWVSAISSSEGNKEGTAVTRGIFACLQADKDRRDMDMDSEEIDADKMSRFIRMNELRLVTEYNPTTAVGVLHSSLLLHLLLFTDKKSPEHPEQMSRYRAAAELFEGKILFILVDINLKSNEQVMAYFKLKKSQLPALAIFHTPDEKHDVLPLDEVSIERVKDFCNTFLQKMQKEEDKLEEKAFNEEL